MKIEYEATFTKINKDAVRGLLKDAGAVLERAEFLQKRAVFFLPEGHQIKGGWARVRDEGDKITMSIKVVDGSGISDQKESQLRVDNFEEAKLFLGLLGCKEKAFQESKRELWKLDEVEITIDEWPFLEPFLEIEGGSEDAVRVAAGKLGMLWEEAKFCAVDVLYAEKYGVANEVINNQTPRLTFGMENPFGLGV